MMRRARSRRLRRPHVGVGGRRTARCATLEQLSRDLRECRDPRHGNARPAGMSHRLRRVARSWASARAASHRSTATTSGGRPSRRAATAAAKPSSREISSSAARACVDVEPVVDLERGPPRPIRDRPRPSGHVARRARCKVNDRVDINVAVEVKGFVNVIVDVKVKIPGLAAVLLQRHLVQRRLLQQHLVQRHLLQPARSGRHGCEPYPSAVRTSAPTGLHPHR